MDKATFINAAYDEVRSLLDISGVVGKPLVVVIHRMGSRSTDFPGSRAVTLRVEGQIINRGERAVFTKEIDALSFYSSVRRELKKMDPPIVNYFNGYCEVKKGLTYDKSTK